MKKLTLIIAAIVMVAFCAVAFAQAPATTAAPAPEKKEAAPAPEKKEVKKEKKKAPKKAPKKAAPKKEEKKEEKPAAPAPAAK